MVMYLFVALAISMEYKVCCPHETGSVKRCKELPTCGVCGAAGVNASSVECHHKWTNPLISSAQISKTVPVLLLDPDSPRKRRVVDLGEMLEVKCTGKKRFVVNMPDRQWCFKAATDADAAMWVACILDVTCESILPMSLCRSQILAKLHTVDNTLTIQAFTNFLLKQYIAKQEYLHATLTESQVPLAMGHETLQQLYSWQYLHGTWLRQWMLPHCQ